MYNLYELLEYQNRIRPEAAFLYLDNVCYTYQKIYQEVQSLSNLLLEKNVAIGERIAVLCDNIDDYVIAIFCCWKLDTCIVPVETAFSAKDQDLYFNIAKVHRCITKRSGQEHFEIQEIRAFDDPKWYNHETVPAELLFTSGSSGIPKAVILSHSTLLGAAIESCDSIHLSSKDKLFTTVPFWHAYGQNRGLLSILYAGAAVVVATEDDFSKRKKMLSMSNPTVLISMPSFFGLLCYAPKDTFGPQCRVALSGAAALAPSIQKKFEQNHNIPLLVTFGLTECQLLSCQRIDLPPKIGSVGHVIRGVKIKIVNDDGIEVSAGEPGTLFVKGHNLMLGYFGGADKKISVDGWLDTEDIAKIASDRSLQILGRNSQFIKRSGYKVYPIEIQNILLEHPDILDAGVCKQDNVMGGEDLAVFVVLKPNSNTDEASILKYCKAHLPIYKIPHSFKIVASIKRLPSGKPDIKGMLKEQVIVES